jgi:outer membrane protein insertion porin family
MIKKLFSIFVFISILSINIHGIDNTGLNLKTVLDVIKDRSSKDKIINNDNKALEEAKDKGNIVQAIEIEGNYYVRKELIENEISLKKGGIFSPYRIRRNVKNINDLGFFSSVKSSVEKVPGGKKVKIIVIENPTVGDIKFDGLKIIPRKELSEVIRAKKDKIFNKYSLRHDIQAIKEVFENKGYFLTKVYKTQIPIKNGDPLIFFISEGTIDEVLVTGNKKTKPYVILREMNLKKGSVIQGDLLKEDLRRIFNLNYFTNIQHRVLPGKTPHTNTLVIHVEERPTNATFQIGGAYSQIMGFSIFSDLYWDNLMGTGQLIMIKGQFGRASTYQIKYHDPWMWEGRKSFSVRTWLTDGSLGYVNPMQQGNIMFRPERRKGVDFSVGWPFSYELRSSHKIKLEGVDILDVEKSYTLQSYTIGFSYDTRDVWFNPSEGEYHTVSIEKGFKLTSKSLDLNRYDIGLRRYFKTFEKQAIAVRFELGYVTSPEIDDYDIFSSEWYYVGGSTTVRGYDDLQPFAYGSKQVVANLEYRFLFNDMFQAVAFYDVGYATNGDITEWDKYKAGKGLGLRIIIPGMGPLRLDYGIDETGTGMFHFNLGHQF